VGLLQNILNNMNISDHFTIQEFTTSETAKRLGIMEQFNPTEDIVHNLTLLAQRVAEPIRDKFGSFSPTCAYRSKTVNESIKPKGAPNSRHITGQAFDETFIKDSKNISDKVFYWLIKSNVPWTKIIWEMGDNDLPRWLHIEYVEGEKQRVFYTFDRKNYLTYFGSVLEKYHKVNGKY